MKRLLWPIEPGDVLNDIDFGILFIISANEPVGGNEMAPYPMQRCIVIQHHAVREINFIFDQEIIYEAYTMARASGPTA